MSVSSTAIDSNYIVVSTSQNPSAASDAPAVARANQQKRQRRPRNPRNIDATTALDTTNSEAGPPEMPSHSQRPQNNQRRRNDRPQRKAGDQDDSITLQDGPFERSGRSSSANAERPQGKHGRRPRGYEHGRDGGAPRGTGRRKRINAKLTNQVAENRSESAPVPAQRREAKADNLTNRLIHALRTPPFADCPICFSAIHPAQPIWSCSPTGSRTSESVDVSEDAAGDSQCCYTPFHLKCIKSWASKSVKDMRDAHLARGETDKQGEWRCPGCQRKRLCVPSAYLCFCGSTPDPRPPRLTTPHSCGNPCSRPRACNHACSLSCHPGPCPPCQVMIQLPCHCGRQIKSFRCADLTSFQANTKPGAFGVDLSCGNICNKLLDCGKHRCSNTCHPGACDGCSIIETARCYCGKMSKPVRCGEGEEKHSALLNEAGVLEEWDGKFSCENHCGRSFSCGIHRCEKPCHPPSASSPPCPRSPSLITHCPCGKRPLAELEGGLRHTCTDPIATCGSICMKKLEGCEHVCSVRCHTGPCPPCSILLIIPCRCGSTTRAITCHEYTSNDSLEILCDKPCTALRACGRHRCNRPCCPLAALDGGVKGKGKKRQTQVQLSQSLKLGLGDGAGWHECDLVCGKMLGCGNHHCEEKDHRGACPPCLRSSFEELICHCGRTIIEPPVPCGTRISCTYPCSRPPAPCGHPKTPHTCHEDPTPCPPCPSLTTKTCACGKNSVRNVRCSQKNVSCGTPCGKLLDCGFHHCERLCHSGGCGPCTSICGKPRKLCLPAHHGCTASCHAPAACSEDEPCQTTIILRCPCGRLQQPSLCGRSTSNPAGHAATQQLKCTNECAIAKRNARLAEALGISQDRERDGPWHVTYSSDLLAFAHANAKFCTVVEKAFADFINSERKSQVLPHMHEVRRKFVCDLAAVYRMDVQMVDQEPKRSVQLIRRIDTRIPKPLLSSTTTPTKNLGKLADLRSSVNPQSAPHTRPSSAASNNAPAPNAERDWTSVVASGPTAQASSSAWDAPVMQLENRASHADRAINGVEPAGPKLALSTRTTTGLSSRQTNEVVPDSWENDET